MLELVPGQGNCCQQQAQHVYMPSGMTCGLQASAGAPSIQVGAPAFRPHPPGSDGVCHRVHQEQGGA
jgi:hypothetical protein